MKDLKGLEIHIVKKHKDVNLEDYFIQNNLGEILNCRICKNKGRFLSLIKGYRDLCLNEECIKKSYETGSIDFWIKKGYSMEDAEKRFKEYTEKRVKSLLRGDMERLKNNPNYYKEKSHNSVEYWIKRGFTKNKSLKMSNNVMKMVSNKSHKIFMDNPEKYASKYPTKIEYYLKRGYTEEQGKQMIVERQKTFTLEKLIQKYGEENAQNIWNKRQEKWLKSLHENGNLKSGYSMVSQELFKKMDEYFPNNKFQYKLKNGEFLIKRFAVDFIDHKTKRIIEFNGDIYHANPNIFESNDTPNPWNKLLLASQIWDFDKKRKIFIESFGYKTLVIWESEYRKYPEQILQKCIEYINEK